MVEISRCWQRVPQDQKKLYKKQAEELQTQYKLDLDLWLRTLSPEEYAAYREATCAKHKNMSMMGARTPRLEGWVCSPPHQVICKECLERTRGFRLQSQNYDTIGEHSPASGRSEDNEKDAEEDATNSSN